MLAVPVPPPPVPIPASPQPVPATGTTAIAVAAADVPSAGFTQLIGAPDSKDAQRVRANGGKNDQTAPVASASDGIDAADGSLAAAASQPGPVDPSDAADAQDQPQQALQKAGATTDDAVLPAPLIQPASAQSGDSAATPQISAQAAPAHHASATLIRCCDACRTRKFIRGRKRASAIDCGGREHAFFDDERLRRAKARFRRCGAARGGKLGRVGDPGAVHFRGGIVEEPCARHARRAFAFNQRGLRQLASRFRRLWSRLRWPDPCPDMVVGKTVVLPPRNIFSGHASAEAPAPTQATSDPSSLSASQREPMRTQPNWERAPPSPLPQATKPRRVRVWRHRYKPRYLRLASPLPALRCPARRFRSLTCSRIPVPPRCAFRSTRRPSARSSCGRLRTRTGSAR